MRWWFFFCGALAFSNAALGAEAVHDAAVHDTKGSGLPDPDTAVWKKLKSSLFENRPMSGDAIELVAPTRAEDGAVVPIAIRARFSQGSQLYVKRLYLIVDNNPSPLAATIDLTPESGRADIETRIRVEQYSYVRAVAELSDGTLAAQARFVKASGGCSAPAGGDPAASARIGRMRLAVDAAGAYNEPTAAQLVVSHPNHSGLAMDQLTRLYTPAYFVRSVKVTYAGKPVFAAEVDFSISENPYFRFYFVPHAPGDLKAEVIDTKELKFESAVAVRRSASRVQGRPEP
ncbi:MAG TPA: quinoprotein dehydrogenase-associated SoxYZ-like carrier [Burkholderiales bacterium]|jgi:sulfur-oxidizing protein SoxY